MDSPPLKKYTTILTPIYCANYGLALLTFPLITVRLWKLGGIDSHLPGFDPSLGTSFPHFCGVVAQIVGIQRLRQC